MQSYGAAQNMSMDGAMPMKQGLMTNSLKSQRTLPWAPRPRTSVVAAIATIGFPWLLFAIVFYIRAMWIRSSYPWLSLGLAAYFLLMVFVAGVMALSAARDSTGKSDARILSLNFLLCLTAWVAACGAGDNVFTHYTAPYYDLTNLNSYPSVNPLTFNGAQLMDAGIIDFQKGAKLDLKKSIGFKNDDVYCVAPVTMEGANKSVKEFDFWAVGTNCCSGHSSTDFKCGEYNMPGVRKGLRLMDDSKREFYRLAVKEAEAAYSIQSGHPVFLYWLSDPAAEVEAYQDDAYRFFMLGVCSFAAVVVFTVLFTVLCFEVSCR